MIAGNPQSGSPGATNAAPSSATNDGSYMGIAQELAEIELRRKRAELYLEHFEHAQEESGQDQQVSDREIEKAFLDDPVVSDLKSRFSTVYDQLAEAKRAARSAHDPAVVHYTERAESLKEEYRASVGSETAANRREPGDRRRTPNWGRPPRRRGGGHQAQGPRIGTP